MASTPDTPTTPLNSNKKRKSRKGRGQYDSPSMSSPAESANASFNAESSTPATPRARRLRKLMPADSQFGPSPKASPQQVSGQPQYMGMNPWAQYEQLGIVAQEDPLNQASEIREVSAQPQDLEVDQLAYHRQTVFIKPRTLEPTPVQGANQQAQHPREHQRETAQAPLLPVSVHQVFGGNQQAQHDLGTLQHQPQGPAAANTQAQQQQAGYMQYPQVPAVNVQIQQQQTTGESDLFIRKQVMGNQELPNSPHQRKDKPS